MLTRPVGKWFLSLQNLQRSEIFWVYRLVAVRVSQSRAVLKSCKRRDGAAAAALHGRCDLISSAQRLLNC